MKIILNIHFVLTPLVVENSPTEFVHKYDYLGQAVRLGRFNFDKEVTRRIKLGWAAFGGKLQFARSRAGYIARRTDNHRRRMVFEWRSCTGSHTVDPLPLSGLTTQSKSRATVSCRWPATLVLWNRWEDYVHLWTLANIHRSALPVQNNARRLYIDRQPATSANNTIKSLNPIIIAPE
ncbi:hypothetical protein EVAR_38166_1 [Eumeta japonica]|uniref:Uncharacterized protein n=1 Tax=Eumeta variegata TaxID=151549 RepID=A0A4C1WDF8_EUMVA|nr:hypothetical protein EVAR_38166_1 [Eumeta japonica]